MGVAIQTLCRGLDRIGSICQFQRSKAVKGVSDDVKCQHRAKPESWLVAACKNEAFSCQLKKSRAQKRKLEIMSFTPGLET
jgi:hypothetical protein